MIQLQKTLIAPPIGIVIFLILFAYSSTLYPGGSQININTIGFSWMHNYWCNLTDTLAMNGTTNPAVPYAITAMVVLCFSIMIFFLRFGQVIQHPIWKSLIQLSGILSMGFSMFIYTSYHDTMIIWGSIFGGITIVGITIKLYKSKLTLYKYSGIGCILIISLNNYIFYTKEGLEILPLLQKITFAIVLVWIIGLNRKLEKLQ